MKLLNKTTIYFLGVSLIIFSLGGILFYSLFQIIVDNDINNKLHERKEYNLKQLARSDSLILFQKYSANMVSIKPVDKITFDGESISDTLIFDPVENKSIIYRQLSFTKRINDRNYSIQVRRAVVEQRPLLKGVIILEAILFLAFVAALTLINNQLSKTIWKPFYFIVGKISNYKVDLAQSMALPKNSIDEFNELSVAIEKMAIKINDEFNIQKEFTENASHEIQTPLAIIRNKLEILLQSPHLSKEEMDLINSASIASTRLSKLNEALIILSKIENRQFHEVKDIYLNDVIDGILAGLDELIKIKSITIERDYQVRLYTKMNPYLAEMFLENLITNAIKHNISPGWISVTTRLGELEIANSGEKSLGNAEKLFKRFVKSNPKSQSLGLGLSIVKGICDTYRFTINYTVEQGYHTMRVTFQ